MCIRDRAVLGQESLAFRRDRVQLLVAIGCGDDMPHVEQHRQQRINRAGAGRIAAAGALFQLLDDLVAMAWLLLNQLQHDVAHGAGIEHFGTATATAATALVRTVGRARMV